MSALDPKLLKLRCAPVSPVAEWESWHSSPADHRRHGAAACSRVLQETPARWRQNVRRKLALSAQRRTSLQDWTRAWTAKRATETTYPSVPELFSAGAAGAL